MDLFGDTASMLNSLVQIAIMGCFFLEGGQQMHNYLLPDHSIIAVWNYLE